MMMIPQGQSHHHRRQPHHLALDRGHLEEWIPPWVSHPQPPALPRASEPLLHSSRDRPEFRALLPKSLESAHIERAFGVCTATAS